MLTLNLNSSLPARKYGAGHRLSGKLDARIRIPIDLVSSPSHQRRLTQPAHRDCHLALNSRVASLREIAEYPLPVKLIPSACCCAVTVDSTITAYPMSGTKQRFALVHRRRAPAPEDLRS